VREEEVAELALAGGGFGAGAVLEQRGFLPAQAGEGGALLGFGFAGGGLGFDALDGLGKMGVDAGGYVGIGAEAVGGRGELAGGRKLGTEGASGADGAHRRPVVGGEDELRGLAVEEQAQATGLAGAHEHELGGALARDGATGGEPAAGELLAQEHAERRGGVASAGGLVGNQVQAAEPRVGREQHPQVFALPCAVRRGRGPGRLEAEEHGVTAGLDDLLHRPVGGQPLDFRAYPRELRRRKAQLTRPRPARTFESVMPGLLAAELQRIADEARSARERLVELIRQAAELRAELDKNAVEASQGEGAPARKLKSVQ
jgi:hypothetical protein